MQSPVYIVTTITHTNTFDQYDSSVTCARVTFRLPPSRVTAEAVKASNLETFLESGRRVCLIFDTDMKII